MYGQPELYDDTEGCKGMTGGKKFVKLAFIG
jgi:hypothetical protein